MGFVEFLFIFILGFTFGVGAMIYYGFYLHKKSKQAKDRLMKALKEEYAKLEAEMAPVKERLQQAFDITELQLDMLHKHEGPQSGPLHGKHRNGIHHEVKRLEEEKTKILQSIIADGHDPSIYIMNEETGEKEQVKLSKYLADKDLLVEKSAPPAPKEKPARKLSLVKTPPEE